jgi:hypothetical protein
VANLDDHEVVSVEREAIVSPTCICTIVPGEATTPGPVVDRSRQSLMS